MPAPVTNHSTVYSCLLNFIDLCEQMEQPSLAFVVDEGVYQYAMDIFLAYPDVFKTIFPMLGGFHMAKALLRCIGTYLEGSGMEDALIECGIFGVKTLEQWVSGSHYSRSFYGMLVVEEVIHHLQWDAFWQ